MLMLRLEKVATVNGTAVSLNVIRVYIRTPLYVLCTVTVLLECIYHLIFHIPSYYAGIMLRGPDAFPHPLHAPSTAAKLDITHPLMSVPCTVHTYACLQWLR